MPTTNTPFHSIRIRKFLLWLLMGIVLYLVLLFLIGIFTPLNPEDPSVSDTLVGIIGYGIVSIWIMRELRKRGGSLRKIFGEIPTRRKFFLYTLAVIPVTTFSLGALILYFYLLSFPFPDFVIQQLNEKFLLDSSDTATPLFYNINQFILAILVAPFIEEIFFRGILLHRWMVKWNLTKALIVSSLIFSLFHIDIVGSFVFGLVAGIIYLKTKTLWVPIIIHMINNTVAFGVPLIEMLINGSSTPEKYTLIQLKGDAVAGLIMVLISLPWVIYFLRHNWPQKSETLPAFDN